MKKFLTLLFIVVLITVLYLLFVLNKYDSSSDEFVDYVKINNYEELKKINPDYIQVKNSIIKDEVVEKEYITNLSLSIIQGLSYYSNPFSDEIVNIKKLDDDSIIFLTYLFMTKGKLSACIKETYLLEQLYKYFEIDDIVDTNVKKYNYDAKGKYYCFKKVEYDKTNLVIDNYEKNNNIIKVTLKEIVDDEVYKWNLEYEISNNSYYMKSYQDLLEELEE